MGGIDDDVKTVANNGSIGQLKEKANKHIDTVKDKLHTKVDEVKNQLHQLGTPPLELAGVNVGRITDTGTVGKIPSLNPSNSSNGEPKKVSVDEFNADKATNKQKGNFGEIISSDNLLNNQSIKAAGYDLKPIGRGAPTSINDKIVKGIDGLYENANTESKIKYVFDEAKFGSSQLGKTKDGPQMSNEWLTGAKTEKSRILKAVGGDQKLANKITKALDEDEVERVLSKVDSNGNVITYRLNAKGEIIGEWP